MDVTTAQLDDQDVKWVSQLALVNAPSATAALFEAETFALVTGPQSPLHDVP
ncbi:MAG: hypothetical protein HOI41_04740 [Acidimicrobiaceae bacterium]|nr:hypothetical protein [Acidimicrobiaceae bacterium]